MSEKSKVPYTKRSDIEKIKSNWGKASLLFERKYAPAIIKAVTATELAANFVIRQELEVRMKVEVRFVNHLLRWANGMQGKLDELILPICKGTDKSEVFVSLKDKITE